MTTATWVSPADGQLIEVMVIEDDRRTREGLCMLIDGTAGHRCVDAFGSVEAALAKGNTRPPDVLLLDIHLPGMLGSEAVPLFRRRFPATAILMLTIYDQEDKIFESICNGADGYLLKTTPPARLLEAIGEARDQGSPMSPEIARKVIRLFRKTKGSVMTDHGLTAQEVQVIKLLAEGFSYQAAGNRLNISINTVRNHIRSIYEKLHVHSKSEAVSKALRSGII